MAGVPAGSSRTGRPGLQRRASRSLPSIAYAAARRLRAPGCGGRLLSARPGAGTACADLPAPARCAAPAEPCPSPPLPGHSRRRSWPCRPLRAGRVRPPPDLQKERAAVRPPFCSLLVVNREAEGTADVSEAVRHALGRAGGEPQLRFLLVHLVLLLSRAAA